MGYTICIIASYTYQEDGSAERMNQTIKNPIRTTLIHAGTPVNLSDKYRYAVCNARNSIGFTEQTETPEKIITALKLLVAHMLALGCSVPS